ncbi:MAG: radical SAM protein [Lutisporaceae bacterium]
MTKDSYMQFFETLQDKGPVAHLFEVDGKGMLYDTGTNKVVKCDKWEYEILKAILSTDSVKSVIQRLFIEEDELEIEQALQKIYNAIQQEDILNVELERKFNLTDHYSSMKDPTQTRLKQLVFEVTESCNLRCRYCTYDDEYTTHRNHGKNSMPLEIAYKALDYLASHNSEEDEVDISFYGGEPLLRFDFIKDCVAYAQKNVHVKKINFNMTTNLTLMTTEIAEYLSINDFTVVASIDGPEDIHNMYRLDSSGKGSYVKAIEGFRKLLKAYGDNVSRRIIINMVYAPPYSRKKLDTMQKFIEEEGFEDIVIQTSYPIPNSIPADYRTDEMDLSMFEWSADKLLCSFYEGSEKRPFNHDSINAFLQNIRHTYPSKEANFLLPLNHCCIPTHSRMYVTCNGDIRICERIMGSLSIGNMFDGIDFETLKEIYDEYQKKSIETCSKCWASKMCTQCFATTYTDRNFDMEKRNKFCLITKETLSKALKLYYKVYLHNPEKLLYIDTLNLQMI